MIRLKSTSNPVDAVHTALGDSEHERKHFQTGATHGMKCVNCTIGFELFFTAVACVGSTTPQSLHTYGLQNHEIQIKRSAFNPSYFVFSTLQRGFQDCNSSITKLIMCTKLT